MHIASAITVFQREKTTVKTSLLALHPLITVISPVTWHFYGKMTKAAMFRFNISGIHFIMLFDYFFHTGQFIYSHCAQWHLNARANRGLSPAPQASDKVPVCVYRGLTTSFKKKLHRTTGGKWYEDRSGLLGLQLSGCVLCSNAGIAVISMGTVDNLQIGS